MILSVDNLSDLFCSVPRLSKKVSNGFVIGIRSACSFTIGMGGDYSTSLSLNST